MSRAKRSGADDREALFEQAMRGVEPLPDRPAPPRRPRRHGGRPVAGERAVRFELERIGDRITGLAPGVSPGVLDPLLTGRRPVELRIDLHGLSTEAARGEVRSALAGALASGLRSLLIVHGRGRRSPDRPQLKESLPGWLAEPPHGRQVLGFTSAAADRGGAGATLVLLRPPRR